MKKRVLSFKLLGLAKYKTQLVASAITPKAARDNGLCSTPDGLNFPYYSIDGKPTGFSRTRMRNEVKGKYRQPIGTGCHLYIPQNNSNNAKLKKRATRIVIVEGEKKAISVSSVLPDQWAVVALGGVNSFWAFRKQDRDSRPIYTVFEIAGIPWLNERAVYICFDSDVSTNVRVREAETVLAETLRGRGCEVYSVVVPQARDGMRQGADDWIAEEGPGDFLDELFLTRPKIMSGVIRPLSQHEPLSYLDAPSPPSFLVYPSVQRGANLWFGLPETLKSLTRNQLIVDVLRERPSAFGGASPWEVRSRVDRVMMLASEEPEEEFVSGMWRCGLGNGMEVGQIRAMLSKIVFYSAPEYDLRLDRLAEAWDMAGRPALVFADHLLGLTPRRDIKGQDVNAVADPMVVIDYYLRLRMLFVKEQVAFVCNAHTSKMNEGVYGSVAWAASSDTLTKFHRLKTEDDNAPQLIIEPFKRRHSAREPVFRLTAKFDAAAGAPYRILYDGEAEVPAKDSAKKDRQAAGEDSLYEVVGIVYKSPGISFDQVLVACNKGERQARTLLGKAEHQGLIFSITEDRRKLYFAGAPPTE